MLRACTVLSLCVLAAMISPGFSRASGSQPLAELCDRYWQGQLESNPTTATSLGDKRYDDRLEDITPAGIAKETKRLEGVLAAARAIDPAPLSGQDRLTRTALITGVERQIAWTSCGFEQWVVDPLGGPQVEFMNLPDFTGIDTPRDGAAYVKRVRAMGGYLDDHIANLRSGLAHGKRATRDAVLKTIDQLERLTRAPAESLAPFRPAIAECKEWSRVDREKFAADLSAAIQKSLQPALARYHDFLRADILPASRPPEKAGLGSLPGGADCYRKVIQVHTSLVLAPEEVHKLGLCAGM